MAAKTAISSSRSSCGANLDSEKPRGPIFVTLRTVSEENPLSFERLSRLSKRRRCFPKRKEVSVRGSRARRGDAPGLGGAEERREHLQAERRQLAGQLANAVLLGVAT